MDTSGVQLSMDMQRSMAELRLMTAQQQKMTNIANAQSLKMKLTEMETGVVKQGQNMSTAASKSQ
jgi:hypothetical protein